MILKIFPKLNDSHSRSRAGIQEQWGMAWKRWVQEFAERLLSENQHQEGASRKGNVRPACQSVGNSWQRQGSCHILQVLYFLPARRNSGSPTLTRRNLLESILPAPPGSKTGVRCDQPCQGHQKPSPIVGRTNSSAQGPCLGLWACRGGALFRKMCPRETQMLLCTSPEERWPQHEQPCWSGMVDIKSRGN